MKLMNNDLLNEERLINRKEPSVGYSTGMTTPYSSGHDFNASYDPNKYQEKIYSQEDMDKVIAMLTLFVDDLDIRIQLEETYQSWKDTDKI